MSLPPGECGEVTASLTLGHIGRKEVAILIQSNAPDTPHKIEMSAFYKPDAEVSATPSELRLGEISSGATDRIALAVNAFLLSAEPVTIESIVAVKDAVDIRSCGRTVHKYANQLGYYRTEFEFEVVPKEELSGDFTDSILINFLPSIRRQLEVPVKGHIGSAWVVSPERTVFVCARGDSPNAIVKREVVMRHSNAAAFRVEQLRNPLAPYLTVGHSQRGSEVRIVLAFDSGAYRSDKQPATAQTIQVTVRRESVQSEIIDIPVSILLL